MGKHVAGAGIDLAAGSAVTMTVLPEHLGGFTRSSAGDNEPRDSGATTHNDS